ncbi:MAG: AIPR family protein, partial [Nitrospirota bacterium]
VVMNTLEITAKIVSNDIMVPLAGISNISEWCKKEACWDRLQSRTIDLKSTLSKKFFSSLIEKEVVAEEVKYAIKVQKIDSGIEAQKKVLDIPAAKWRQIMTEGIGKKIFSPKEIGILQVAAEIPVKIPSEKQSAILVDILKKAAFEGIK